MNDPTNWNAQDDFDALTFASYTDAKKAEVLFNRMQREIERLSVRPEAPLNDARLSELAKRVIDYDNAIESCGNDPDKMSSLCTAQGDDLDTLYFMMVDAAKAIKRDETIPSPLARRDEDPVSELIKERDGWV